VLVEIVDRVPRDDERIVRSAAVAEANDDTPTTDVTLWWLLGLAALGVAVLAVLATW
jgi:hypothetical protein